jgi:hypothetical protein
MLKNILALLVLAFFTTACANQAMILSEPAGAQVYIDGTPVGKTPCKYEYANSTGTSFEVTVEKPGYQPLKYRIETDETDVKARNKWLAAGLLIPMGSPLFLGTFFTKKLKDSYNFVMKKAAPQLTAQADRSDAPRPF